MSRPARLQARLGVALAAGVTVLWLVAAIGGTLVVRDELGEAFDGALRATAQRLLPLALTAADSLTSEGPAADGSTPAPRVRRAGDNDGDEGSSREFLAYLVRNRSGQVLIASHDADPALFPATPIAGFHDTSRYRLFGETAGHGAVVIEVAEPLSHRREAVEEAATALVLPLAALIPLSLAGVWWLVRRSMHPVLALSAEIEARGGADLSPVAAGDLPAEVAPTAEAVNRLMERLRRALEAERAFTANSAHELRTPIASMLAQTQRLIAEVPDGAARDRARTIEAALYRLARLSEKLMQLAKAEGGGLLSETPHDPAVVLAHVADEFRREAAIADPLHLSLPATGTVTSHIDADAFAILMRNLVENALKHGEPDEPVDISLSPDGTVRVVNAGPPVPAETLAHLRSRFARGTTGAAGAGLGLAIADTIATGAGAHLELLSPASGRTDGFEAVLRLPP